ncbi:MAG: ATP-dependent Clp protease adaptor ClpS, partial [Methylophilaceae bacterium]|nr:ATP-dependent Clp protease adaptor ClpS [Methylophilaceae bacterium]
MATKQPTGDIAIELSRLKPKLPSMYKVLLKNDDYTPMEFVVETIQRFFNKTREQATEIMLQVHTKGAICFFM